MKKKKNSKKSKALEIVLEIILEIAITAVFFGIGYAVLRLFGCEADAMEYDVDGVALIGFAVIATVCIIAFILFKAVRRKSVPSANDNNKNETKKGD